MRRVFPAYGVRFIAINDNIDTLNESTGDDLTVSVKNIMNEAYARDISIKTRSSLETKRKNGDFVGAFPVYGYRKSEDNHNLLVVDEYAAQVVRSIFRMRLEGFSPYAIANELNRLGTLSPLAYKKYYGLPHAKKGYTDRKDCRWSANTVTRILQDETYTGTLVQGRKGSQHFKLKEMESRPSSEWVRVENAHEAIIDRNDFDLVQRIRNLDTRTSPQKDKVYLFSGILVCGCCGSRMVRKTNRYKDKEYHYYYCPTGKKNGCAHPVMVKEHELMECVRDSLKGFIANVVSLDEILSGIDQSRINRELIKEYSRQIAQNEQQLEQIRQYKMAAPVVRQIFQWAYEKVPLNRIVLMLNEGNYPSPGKYKMQTGEITHQALAGRGYWQTWTVAKILKEDKYTGDMVQGRTKTVLHRQVPAGEENLIVVTGTHEPIVSKEIFDAVQKYRAEVAEESKKHPIIPYTPNIFKGRIFCGDCGRSLHRQRQQCNGSYRFHCLTPTRVHKDKCAGISISETELIATVLDILKRELAAVLGDYALLLNDNMQKQEKEAATREKINRAKLQLNQSREFLQTLYESLMNGAIDSEEYFVLKATYEEQMQAAQKELSFYENQSAVRLKQAEKCKNLEKDEQELLAGGSLTAALIERLIERITVYPNKQVDVKFTFRTEFEAFKEAAAE